MLSLSIHNQPPFSIFGLVVKDGKVTRLSSNSRHTVLLPPSGTIGGMT